MKRLATPTVVFAALIAVLAGCAGAAGRRPASDSSGNVGQSTVSAFAGTWHGLVTGREMAGGGLAQRATLVVQPDGRYTLTTGVARSEGTSRVIGDVLELEGRFVADGARAGARLEKVGDGLMGLVDTHFPLTGNMTTGIRLERERGDSIQASPTQPTAAASAFEGGQFAGTWLGTATGREMFNLAQPARLVVQPDGRWTLTTGAVRSEGTISRIAGDVLELDGRFVPDGGAAGARLQRGGDGRLRGTVSSRFFLTGSINVGIELERERADSIQVSPTQPTTAASPFEWGRASQTQ